jgi:hypothetical protein
MRVEVLIRCISAECRTGCHIHSFSYRPAFSEKGITNVVVRAATERRFQSQRTHTPAPRHSERRNGVEVGS